VLSAQVGVHDAATVQVAHELQQSLGERAALALLVRVEVRVRVRVSVRGMVRVTVRVRARVRVSALLQAAAVEQRAE